MYDVTIEHPAIDDRQFTCEGFIELYALVWGVMQAQGKPLGDDRRVIADVRELQARTDAAGTGELSVYAATVRVGPADETDYGCDGHESVYVGLGETVYCDGKCRPRRRFNREALIDLSLALDDTELDESGGACGTEADEMCEGCGLCNCDTHGSCARPASEPDPARK